MIKIPALHLPLRDWLLEGPLSAQVPAYVARLKRGGYAAHTFNFISRPKTRAILGLIGLDFLSVGQRDAARVPDHTGGEFSAGRRSVSPGLPRLGAAGAARAVWWVMGASANGLATRYENDKFPS